MQCYDYNYIKNASYGFGVMNTSIILTAVMVSWVYTNIELCLWNMYSLLYGQWPSNRVYIHGPDINRNMKVVINDKVYGI